MIIPLYSFMYLFTKQAYTSRNIWRCFTTIFSDNCLADRESFQATVLYQKLTAILQTYLLTRNQFYLCKCTVLLFGKSSPEKRGSSVMLIFLLCGSMFLCQIYKQYPNQIIRVILPCQFLLLVIRNFTFCKQYWKLQILNNHICV